LKVLKKTIAAARTIRERSSASELLCLAQIPMLVLCSVSVILMAISLFRPGVVSMAWTDIPIILVDFILFGIVLMTARPPRLVAPERDDESRGRTAPR
jgi:hypothetical protein